MYKNHESILRIETVNILENQSRYHFKYGKDFFSLLTESQVNSSIRTVEWKGL